MSKFFNKKKNIKISHPITFDDANPEIAATSEKKSSVSSLSSSGSNAGSPISPAFKSANSVIILIAKYDFQAHNSKELTVTANEPLKLLSRQGNGWVLVKPVGRLGGPGLVPSAYCSFVKTEKPMMEEWLNGSDLATEESFTGEKARSNSDLSTSVHSKRSLDSLAVGSPSSLSSVEDSTMTPFVNSISVKTVSSHKGRYWYRTDLILPDGRTRCLCRYYQDFYSLHAALYDQLYHSGLIKQLPKLPGPIPRPDPEVLLQRCHDLNAYVQNLRGFLFSHEESATALQVFKDFLQLRDGDIEMDENDYLAQRTEEINKLIDPLSPSATPKESSIDASKKKLPQVPAGAFAKPPTMDTMKVHLLQSAESSPVSSPVMRGEAQFSSEQQQMEGPTTPKKQQLKVNTTDLTYSPTSPLFHNNKPKLDFITERRAQSPVLPSSATFGSEDYIRVKVIYNEGKDIIALKMLKDSNLTILKLSISSKIQIFDYVLSYKDFKSGFFKPLRTNRDLHDALNKNKIVIRVSEVASVL